MRSAIIPDAWKKFMDGLERTGFFEGELEGSKRYREKTAMAEVMCDLDPSGRTRQQYRRCGVQRRHFPNFTVTLQ